MTIGLAEESLLAEHRSEATADWPAAWRDSRAGPALPSCGLALAESERLMPSVVDRFEAELVGEALHTPVGDEVLEPGMAAIRPIAVITEDRGDDPNGLNRLVHLYEAQRLGQAGEGIALAVGQAQSAADQKVESADGALLDDGQQAAIVDQDVRTVIGFGRQADLEFSGQVAFPVEGVLRFGSD